MTTAEAIAVGIAVAAAAGTVGFLLAHVLWWLHEHQHGDRRGSWT